MQVAPRLLQVPQLADTPSCYPVESCKSETLDSLTPSCLTHDSWYSLTPSCITHDTVWPPAVSLMIQSDPKVYHSWYSLTTSCITHDTVWPQAASLMIQSDPKLYHSWYSLTPSWYSHTDLSVSWRLACCEPPGSECGSAGWWGGCSCTAWSGSRTESWSLPPHPAHTRGSNWLLKIMFVIRTVRIEDLLAFLKKDFFLRNAFSTSSSTVKKVDGDSLELAWPTPLK